jgi:glycosyltransferase involved in cell wall biosynthesis
MTGVEAESPMISVTKVQRPFLSIVIPMFNREKEIKRAIDSCLNQSYPCMEVIVVDDASSDASVAIVKEMQKEDSRLQLLEHPINKGLYPTRATGVEHARGDWILFLDSDDEMILDSIENISNYMIKDGLRFDRYGFMYRIDNGSSSPDPSPVEGQILDYQGYLEWVNRIRSSDYFHCIRRDTFVNVPLTIGRSMYELLYHLRFAKQYQTRLSTHSVAIIHTDSGNRASNLGLMAKMDKISRERQDGEHSVESIWLEHGPSLREWAPVKYNMVCKLRGMFRLLNGKRLEGSALMLRYLIRKPYSLQGWVILLSGLLGPKFLTVIKALKGN